MHKWFVPRMTLARCAGPARLAIELAMAFQPKLTQPAAPA
jgi:hypothetical protein